jgi:hypothetical protein
VACGSCRLDEVGRRFVAIIVAGETLGRASHPGVEERATSIDNLVSRSDERCEPF